MFVNKIFNELSARIKREITHESERNPKREELIKKIREQEKLHFTINKTSAFSNIYQLVNYLETISKNNQVKIITFSGIEFLIPQTEEEFESVFKRLSLQEKEGYPSVLKQDGIYIKEPYGKMIWDGLKKAIIEPEEITRTREPLYLLSGKLCYGVIQLSKGQKINLNAFMKLYEQHKISESERKKEWPDEKEFYLHHIKFINRWDPPRKWKVQSGPGLIIEDVKFEESQKEDEPNREETISKEMTKHGNWYLVKQPKGKDFKYVVQAHIRGDSAHLDIRFEANDHLVGITMNTPNVQEGEVKPQKDLIETNNNKFLFPVTPSKREDYQILTELKLIQPKVWLKVQGKIPAGGIGATRFKEAEFRILSRGTMRFGTQKTDFHEYFLKPDGNGKFDKNIKGRWIHALIPRPAHYTKAGEGKTMWGLWKALDQRPYMEYHKFETEAEKAEKENIDMIWQGPDGEDFRVVSGKNNLPEELKQFVKSG